MLVEKYRPKNLDQVVGHKSHIAKLKGFIEKNELPNLCFYGKSGNGKTAVAHGLAGELGCVPHALLELNASDEISVSLTLVESSIRLF